ncbi:hypothetical protein L6452_25347 [Arctium lappa]|uniref:Uncharacterized protein n=1 Tax=Arctium lappa TaxID=4217 RepID=A0ACB9AAT6_ARCLA|nr:hypothetical protein L6452_25347 [Arctium lappa]
MVAMVVVMTTTTSHATYPDSPFCQYANLKPLCNEMVNGAKTHNDALKNAFKATLILNKKNSVRLVPVITSVVQKTSSPSKANILKTCHQKLIDVTSYINDLIVAVDEDNKDLIEYTLRTGEITLRDCVDSITEIDMPIPSELSKLAKDVENYKETALVIFLQAPIETVYNRPMPVDYSG